MENEKKALPAEGAAKPAQTSLYQRRTYEVTVRDRRFLLCTAAFCVLLVHTLVPCGFFSPSAGQTAAVFAWYVLLAAYLGSAFRTARSGRALLTVNLLLALTFALGSNGLFRVWNGMALLVLLPVHALAGAGRLPWYRPAMVWERLCLLLVGLFGNLGAGPAALRAGEERRDRRRTVSLLLGLGGALALVCVLLPVLASADALFAAATAELRAWMRAHLAPAAWQVLLGAVITPFCFGLLYAIRRPEPLRTAWTERTPHAETPAFVLVLGALDGLYLLFLAVQSAGLFGGPEYLAQRGISYAEWARSGFFQMVGVTVLNLSVLLAALTLSKREDRFWGVLRLLAGLLTLESLVLLASAAWRMTLYISAYGLSFKRCMTYWGMGMMALLFLTALWKTAHPDFSFCRRAFPLLLAGWLAVNCVPIDFLVARDQVDRCLSGQSETVDAEYLLYGLSYDTLGQLERLDGTKVYRIRGGVLPLSYFIEGRREDARQDCRDWRTWSLSACLASF